MKKLLFLSTKLRMFWVMVPPIVMLIPVIRFNDGVKTLMKLYPLMVALVGLILFFAVYLFRAVSISKKEIKCIGVFSSKEMAKIEPGRTLVITVPKKRRIKIEIFGMNDDSESSYAWLKNDEPCEINLFRATVGGGIKTAEKIVRYFENDKNTVSSEKNEENKIFRISFN